MKAHVVEAGDWIVAIAKRYGFADWAQIWNDASNEQLRAKRGSPDLLMVGDVLSIPDAPTAGVEVPVGKRAVFVLRARDVLRVRVAGLRVFIEELGPIAFELRCATECISGQLTEDGQVIELPLPPDATAAELFLNGRKVHELAIGGLGPASEHKGAFGRLQSLGYTAEIVSAPESGKQAVADPVVTALQRFQRRHGLPATGELDAATSRALEAEYGS